MEDEWDMDSIRSMVSKTKGYYARDYSVWLGWNNMRYIIEASLLHANLLNRTLVLPSYVYARACEHNIHTCADFSEMVNRGDAIGWDEWKILPIEEQMGWRVPISVMLDLNRLRHFHPVVTVAEYLQLHDLDLSKELPNGRWGRTEYLQKPDHPSLFIIPNKDFDHGKYGDLVRVDKLPPPPPGGPSEPTDITKILLEELKASGRHTINIDGAKSVLEFQNSKAWGTEAELENILEREGWLVLYTFEGPEAQKTVVFPVKQFARRELARGLVDDYDKETAHVLLLDSETHDRRPAGDLRFTTESARKNFANLILQGVKPLPSIFKAAERVAERMLEVNGGRMWVAAHMRRGDFLRWGFQLEYSIRKHLERIKNNIQRGREVLRDMSEKNVSLVTYDVPNVTPDTPYLRSPPPNSSDKFFIATDARTEGELKHIRENGGVLIVDLLSPSDRRLVGWPLLITDVMGILEQVVMSHAHYFCGYHVSSLPGGVLNLRASGGMDPRTAFIDLS
ncbi:uncharacterized protein EI90DRAFT_2907527 [Cantharellus anzutake]|uniref:uncharacterized protein n=1 Tax=Cantharellus anzutake TaxID=1750568 RepID=UPI0019085722|nr:uncharacterized protein EI90DRAFT_2907527 [Cantharellus anzutake]KAF8340001.1 hypothetical protein EI90DRAFT_2907527 [Cantharellus anzutake]